MRPNRTVLVFIVLWGLAISIPGAAVAEGETALPVTIVKVQALNDGPEDSDRKGAASSACQSGDILPTSPVQSDAQLAPSEQANLEPGARFPVAIDRSATSQTAHIGDIIEAHLTDDLSLGVRLVAPKGSRVRGHVCSVQKARRVLKAELSRHRWLKSAGELGIQFDEIITDQDEHLPLVAAPVRQARFVNDMNEGRVLGINDKGEIVSPLSAQLKSQSIHWGIHVAVTAAGIAGGPIGLGVIPATYACLGAINPSFAFMHPVGKNMKHRRVKGFALGLISGVPGGGLVCDAIVRGPEAKIEPGDSFEAELKQPFTGEPAVVAQSEESSCSSATVHGQVLPSEADAQVGDEKLQGSKGL